MNTELEKNKWYYQLYGRYYPDNKARAKMNLKPLPKQEVKIKKFKNNKVCPDLELNYTFLINPKSWCYPMIIEYAEKMYGTQFTRLEIKRALPDFPITQKLDKHKFKEIIENPTKPSHHIIRRIWNDNQDIVEYSEGEVRTPPTGLEPLDYEPYQYLIQHNSTDAAFTTEMYIQTGIVMQPPYSKTNVIVAV